MTMYYLDNDSVWYYIKSKTDKEVLLGPFDSNSDAFFITEMLNTGKMRLELKTHGEEGA